MNKRKTFVEQMTTYLNDRIRELNKVSTQPSTNHQHTRYDDTDMIDRRRVINAVKLMSDVLWCAVWCGDVYIWNE